MQAQSLASLIDKGVARGTAPFRISFRLTDLDSQRATWAWHLQAASQHSVPSSSRVSYGEQPANDLEYRTLTRTPYYATFTLTFAVSRYCIMNYSISRLSPCAIHYS